MSGAPGAGVRLRGSASVGPLPPPECDLGLPLIESQCIMKAEDHGGEWVLVCWTSSGCLPAGMTATLTDWRGGTCDVLMRYP